MSRLEVAIMVLIIALVAMIVFFGPKAKAEEWDQNSDANVTVSVTTASDVPVSMPVGMVSSVATIHRSFGIVFPGGKEVRVHLGSQMLMASDGSTISAGQVADFFRALKGARAFMVEAEKRELSLQGIEIGLDPEAKEPYFKEIIPEEGGLVLYRLVGNFADEGERKLALSALGAEDAKKKK